MAINYANVVALTKTKVASLGAGMASSRPPAKFHSRPWSDTTEAALLSAKPGHRGRSPSPMGETAAKTAAIGFKMPAFKVPSFNLPNMKLPTPVMPTMRGLGQSVGRVAQRVGNAMPDTHGLRNTIQGINSIPGAVGSAVKAHPRIAAGVGATAGIGGLGLGANALHYSYANGARNKLMDAMGGEGQVRSLLGGVGIDVPEGQPITEAHIGQAATKLREMQQGGLGGMMGQLGQWWQGLDPQIQQALISVPAGMLLGGVAGGMPGAVIGGGLGAALPYASPYAMNWMRQQGLMQPQATN